MTQNSNEFNGPINYKTADEVRKIFNTLHSDFERHTNYIEKETNDYKFLYNQQILKESLLLLTWFVHQNHGLLL